ncbi:hypothetical protein N7519_003866 [Penicillium mononematosum]|uniref:uncharacterized protein n=1 Tax=Penicillium mononematosum TaxID=268346 RepID=UPI002547A486|nr:uncharacterized protein N7519_003866 [Penicillium mononematosum]KAJ6188958.1 hypothetical protein N7519_003866 [Penicillium mononematosum]
MPVLYPRYCSGYYQGNDCYSTWDSWGRWVAFAVIVGVAFLLFFSFANRVDGSSPGPPPPNQPIYQQPPYGDPYYQQNAPPQYSPNPQHHGYFGAQNASPQQQGIELQQPPNAYGTNGYAPPPGPPPNGRKD